MVHIITHVQCFLLQSVLLPFELFGMSVTAFLSKQFKEFIKHFTNPHNYNALIMSMINFMYYKEKIHYLNSNVHSDSFHLPLQFQTINVG